jgi:hypothetical protein
MGWSWKINVTWAIPFECQVEYIYMALGLWIMHLCRRLL